MNKSFYFVTSPSHMKRLPDYQKLVRKHLLSYTAQANLNNPKAASNFVPGRCAIPIPTGMRMLSSHSESADYDLIDLEMFLDGPTSNDDEYIDAEVFDQNDCNLVAKPEWAEKFKLELQHRALFNMRQPVIFHLPTYSTPEIVDLVNSVCVELALPFAEIKGNADDDYFDLLPIQQNTSLVTYLSEPDFEYLQSSWAHQRLGNVWFWVNPFPLAFESSHALISLPFAGQQPALLDNTVLLADPTVVLRQIKQLAATKGESPKADYLKQLIKPKPLRMATQADVDAISALIAAYPQFKTLFGKLRSRLVGQCLSKYPIHLGSQLLIGPAGNGKTWLCTKIAEALNLPFLNIQLSGNSDVMILRGSQHQWTGSDAGRPVKFMATCEIANPIIMFDEVDKAGSSQYGHLTDTILMLLEPENSRCFMDNFIEASIDMHYISFILTANVSDCLSAPLMSRLEVNAIVPPNQEEMRVLAQSFYQQELKARKISHYFVPEISAADLQVIVFRSESIRELRRQIVLAIENGLNDVTDVSDVEMQQYLLKPIPAPEPPKNTPYPGIGFLTKH